MEKNKKLKKINCWAVASCVLLVSSVIFLIMFIQKNNELNEFKLAQVHFDMDSYIANQFVNGKITYDLYARYEHDKYYNGSVALFGIAAVVAALGILIHGISLVNIDNSHHNKKENEDFLK